MEEGLEKRPIATSAASPRDLGEKIFKAEDRESRERMNGEPMCQ